jgi:hypothetical protein
MFYEAIDEQLQSLLSLTPNNLLPQHRHLLTAENFTDLASGPSVEKLYWMAEVRSALDEAIGIGFRGAKSRPAINPSEDNSNSTEFGAVLRGPRHYCSVESGDSSILCVGVNGAGSKSSMTDVTGCDIKIGSENTKNGRNIL